LRVGGRERTVATLVRAQDARSEDRPDAARSSLGARELRHFTVANDTRCNPLSDGPFPNVPGEPGVLPATLDAGGREAITEREHREGAEPHECEPICAGNAGLLLVRGVARPKRIKSRIRRVPAHVWQGALPEPGTHHRLSKIVRRNVRL